MTSQRLSVFDILKIGVGPSSSHTMGPWRAAQRFLTELQPPRLPSVTRIQVDLYGSLAKTGHGHGTDTAVQLGLSGEDPVTIDVADIPIRVERIAKSKQLPLGGEAIVPFDPATDILFHRDQVLPLHPNGMRITARFADQSQHEAVYYSVGGGFVIKEDDASDDASHTVPFPIDTAAELLAHCRQHTCRISDVVRRNELSWRGEAEVASKLAEIREAMFASIHRGCLAEGVLPGGLNVQRRAAALARRLLGAEVPTNCSDWMAAIERRPQSFQNVLDWVSCFALAVNEENAAFGRIVTAPTNGAAGVIPAVLMYCQCFCQLSPNASANFLLTAGEVGCIFKKCATISAAMGGCQAEIGVSSAMAAAALAETLGGSPEQAAEAAEIAMEHHLGMTCDPIGGLVQIPCIERNAMGAIKAITAAQMAVQRNPNESRVSLDDVIKTMWETAQDMNAKYKETSEGGLAVQIAVNVSEC